MTAFLFLKQYIRSFAYVIFKCYGPFKYCILHIFKKENWFSSDERDMTGEATLLIHDITDTLSEKKISMEALVKLLHAEYLKNILNY